MNYDITFCEGRNCKRKEQCRRYCELLRFRADTDPNKKTYITMTNPNDPTKCTLIWRNLTKGRANANTFMLDGCATNAKRQAENILTKDPACWSAIATHAPTTNLKIDRQIKR